MTKTLLLVSTLLLAAGPALAQQAPAQSLTSSVTLNASVQPLCAISTPASQIIDINAIPANGGSIIDVTDGTLNATTPVANPLSAFAGGAQNLTAWCNGTNSTVTVNVDGLSNTDATGAPGDADFVNYIDIALTGWQVDGVALPDVTTSLGASNTTGPVAMGRVFSGQFDGNIGFVDTGLKLVAGAYTGSFSITIAAVI